MSSNLFSQMNAEWSDLVQDPAATRALAAWRRKEKALVGSVSLDVVLAELRHSDYERRDAVAGALMRLAQAGHQMAGRVLLQDCIDSLVRMASWGGRCSGEYAGRDTRNSLAISLCWEAITEYDAQKYPRCIMVNVIKRTKERYWRAIRRHPDELVSDELVEAEVELAPAPHPAPVALELGENPDLIEVALWAVGRGVLTSAEASLLLQVYLPRPERATQAQIAREAGLDPAALRKRVSRLRARLTEAVEAELAQQRDVDLAS